MAICKLGIATITWGRQIRIHSQKLFKEDYVTVLKGSVHNECVNGLLVLSIKLNGKIFWLLIFTLKMKPTRYINIHFFNCLKKYSTLTLRKGLNVSDLLGPGVEEKEPHVNPDKLRGGLLWWALQTQRPNHIGWSEIKTF